MKITVKANDYNSMAVSALINEIDVHDSSKSTSGQEWKEESELLIPQIKEEFGIDYELIMNWFLMVELVFVYILLKKSK